MGFEKVYITDKGLELEAKARVGKNLNLVRVEAGDGSLIDENVVKQTNLVNKILNCNINSLVEVGSQTIVNFVLQQSEIEQGFFFRELGIIAIDPDTAEEVLYAYSNAGNKAEYINDKTALSIQDKIFDIILKEDNTDKLTFKIDSTGVYVEKLEYQNRVVELLTLINTKANKKKTYSITIDTANWSEEAPYTKTIELQDILATDIVKMYPVWSEDLETRQTEKEEYSKISVIKSVEKAIQLICDEDKPSVDLNVRLEVTY